jgi:hypothetical protein
VQDDLLHLQSRIAELENAVTGFKDIRDAHEHDHGNVGNLSGNLSPAFTVDNTAVGHSPVSSHREVVPKAPQFIGPTRSAFGINIGECFLTRMGIPTYEPTLPSGAQSPSQDTLCSGDYWQTITSAEVARLLTVFQEEVESIYPILNIGEQAARADQILHAIQDRPPLHSPADPSLSPKDVDIVKVAVATAIVLETHGKTELSTQIVQAVENNVQVIARPEVDLKEIQLIAMLVGACPPFFYSSSCSFLHAHTVPWKRVLRHRDRVSITSTAATSCSHGAPSASRRERRLRWACIEKRVFSTTSRTRKHAALPRACFGASTSWIAAGASAPASPLPLWTGTLTRSYRNQYVIHSLHHLPREILMWRLKDEEFHYLKCMVAYGWLSSKLWEAIPPFGAKSLVIPEDVAQSLDTMTKDWLLSIPWDLQLRHPRLGLAPASQPRALHRIRTLLYLRGNHSRTLIYRHHLLSAQNIAANMRHAQLVVDIAQDSILVLVHLNATTDIYSRQQSAFNYFLISALSIIFLAVCHAPESFTVPCRKSFLDAVELIRGFSRHSLASRRLWMTVHRLLQRLRSLGLHDAEDDSSNSADAAGSPEANVAAAACSGDDSSLRPDAVLFGDSYADSGGAPDLDMFQVSNELLSLFDAFGQGQVLPETVGAHFYGPDDGGLAGLGQETSRQFHDLI